MTLDNVVSLRGRRKQPPGNSIAALKDSWRLTLEEEGKAEGTIKSYLRSANDLAVWLAGQGIADDVETIEPQHLRGYLAAVRERSSEGNAAKDYRNLSVFWRWLIEEGERTPPNPMDRVEKIIPTKKVFPIFTEDELRTLIEATSGTSFENRRDRAILRIFIDNGVRVSGLADVRYTPDDPETNDVFLQRRYLRIRLKDREEFFAPIGKKATAEIDRYLRKRRHHRQADSPWLWLPVNSKTTRTGDCRLTANGIHQMVERRGNEAGIVAHPHKFRRDMATKWQGDIVTLMSVGGWKTLAMAKHYSQTSEAERALAAHAAHAAMSPGDRI